MSTVLSGTGADLRGASANAAGAALALEHVPAGPSTAATSLSRGHRLRLSFLGFAIALLALAACVAAGLLIVAGPFHTSLGSLA